MMRAAILVACMTATAVAATPAPQVKAVVRTFLANADNAAKVAPTLRPGSILVVDSTVTLDAPHDAVAYLMATSIRRVGSVTIAIDGHGAWFEATASGATFDQTGDGCHPKCPPPLPLDLHVSGLALDDSGGWKLAVIIVSTVRSDAALVVAAKAGGLAVSSLPGKPDAADTAKAVASWFPDRKLSSSAAHGTVFAAGTSSSELASADAARALAARWDKLALAPVLLDGETIADGITFVYGETRWSVRKQVIPLRVAAIVVREGDAWRWRVIDFSGP